MLRSTYKNKISTLDKFTLSKRLDKFNEVIDLNNDLKYYKNDYEELYKTALKESGDDEVVLIDKCDVEITGRIFDNQGKFDTKNCIAEKKADFSKKLEFKESYNIFDYEVLTEVSSSQGDILKEYSTNQITIVNPELKLDLLLSNLGIDLNPIAGFYIEYIKIEAKPIFAKTIITPPIIENGVVISEGSYLLTYITHNIKGDVHRIKQTSSTSIEGWSFDVANQIYYKPFKLLDLNVEYNYNFATSPNLELKLGATFYAGRVNKYRKGFISNIRSFRDLLDNVFQTDIVSNFFNVNPDSTNPNNKYYDFAAKYCSNIGIAQTYDIIRASALQDSFGKSGDFDCEKLIEDINTYFNTIMVYYPEGDIIRLEHVSYFNTKGIEAVDYIIGQIEFDTSLVKSETWNSAAATLDKEHSQTKIAYKNKKAIEDKNYKAELLHTDFTELWENNEYEKRSEFEKGFMIMSLDDANQLIDFNDVFSIKNLVTILHDLNRPSKVGYQDEKPTQFETKSYGISTSVEIEGNLGLFNKLHINNSIKLKEGIFYIDEIEFKETYKLNIKLKK